MEIIQYGLKQHSEIHDILIAGPVGFTMPIDSPIHDRRRRRSERNHAFVVHSKSTAELFVRSLVVVAATAAAAVAASESGGWPIRQRLPVRGAASALSGGTLALSDRVSTVHIMRKRKNPFAVGTKAKACRRSPNRENLDLALPIRKRTKRSLLGKTANAVCRKSQAHQVSNAMSRRGMCLQYDDLSKLS